MRVLDWMHNKLRHKAIDPFKDFTIGNYCACVSAKSTLDDRHWNVRPRFNSIYEDCPKASFEVEGNTEYGDYEDETSTVMSQYFHGFLAIGTLGSEPVNSEPPTPTFPMSMEDIKDEKSEVTENHLKLINSELEKFFEAEAEAEEEGSNESMARSSYVIEVVNNEDYGKVALFPLQGYLFGSTIQLPETTPGLKKERTSLGEIFHRTKIIDEISAQPDKKGEMQTKQVHMSAKNLMEKMLKRFNGSSRSPAPGNDAGNSVSTKKKLNKIRRLFHRKVHPENSLSEKEYTKSHLEIKKTMDHHVNLVCQDEDSDEFPPGPNSMEEMQSYENNLKQSQHDLSCSNPSGNTEHWIKTDAEYLVLEL